jgi:DNA-binding MarR family transcriptional regulator
MAERLSLADQVARSTEEAGPDFDPLALALTLSLYRTMTAFDRAHAEELAPVGLSVTQFNVLTVLHRAHEPLTMGELGQAVSVRSANLTGVADGLTTRGLVERELNPHDRRSFLVRITQAGEDFLGGFLPSHWRVLEELMAGLDRSDRTQLLGLLEKLLSPVGDAEPQQQPPARPVRPVRSATRRAVSVVGRDGSPGPR